MVDFNYVHLGGRLTRDPELNQTSGGTSVADLGLAVNRTYQGEEETSFFDVTVWGDQAENVAEYLSKGSEVIVTGRLQQDRWQNESGENRSKVKVVAQDVRFIGGGSGGGPEHSGQQQAAGDSSTSGAASSTGQGDDEFSDIPF